MTDKEFEYLSEHLVFRRKRVKNADILYFFYIESNNRDMYENMLTDVADDRNVFRIVDYCKNHNLTVVAIIFKKSLFGKYKRYAKGEKSINSFFYSTGILIPDNIALQIGEYAKRCEDIYENSLESEK